MKILVIFKKSLYCCKEIFYKLFLMLFYLEDDWLLVGIDDKKMIWC